jgi:hypothetical protein
MPNKFFQAMVRKEMEVAQRDIRALFRDEPATIATNWLLLGLCRSAKLTIAHSGRPVQPNESANAFVPSANPVEEVERLEREVEQLSARRLRRELPPANASE